MTWAIFNSIWIWSILLKGRSKKDGSCCRIKTTIKSIEPFPIHFHLIHQVGVRFSKRSSTLREAGRSAGCVRRFTGRDPAVVRPRRRRRRRRRTAGQSWWPFRSSAASFPTWSTWPPPASRPMSRSPTRWSSRSGVSPCFLTSLACNAAPLCWHYTSIDEQELFLSNVLIELNDRLRDNDRLNKLTHVWPRQSATYRGTQFSR